MKGIHGKRAIVGSRVCRVPGRNFYGRSRFRMARRARGSIAFLLGTGRRALGRCPCSFRLCLSCRLGNDALSVSCEMVGGSSSLVCCRVNTRPNFVYPIGGKRGVRGYVLEFRGRRGFVSCRCSVGGLRFGFGRGMSRGTRNGALPLAVSVFSRSTIFFRRAGSRCISFMGTVAKGNISMCCPSFRSLTV